MQNGPAKLSAASYLGLSFWIRLQSGYWYVFYTTFYLKLVTVGPDHKMNSMPSDKDIHYLTTRLRSKFKNVDFSMTNSKKNELMLNVRCAFYNTERNH